MVSIFCRQKIQNGLRLDMNARYPRNEKETIGIWTVHGEMEQGENCTYRAFKCGFQ